MEILVHGVVEHLEVHLVVLVHGGQLLAGQLRDQLAPGGRAAAEVAPVPHPRQLGQVPRVDQPPLVLRHRLQLQDHVVPANIFGCKIFLDCEIFSIVNCEIFSVVKYFFCREMYFCFYCKIFFGG